MSHWVMLRSANENCTKGICPSTSLSDNDDMWTHLFYSMLKEAQASGTIWKKGITTRIIYDNYLQELWCPNMNCLKHVSKPDVIFNRGGYSDYEFYLNENRQALRIYYGAGKRYIPSIFHNLVLVDTPRQKHIVRRKFPKSKVVIIHKPTIDSLFTPIDAPKIYDAVLMTSSIQDFKGFSWILSRLPQDARILRIGHPDQWFQGALHIKVDFSGRLERKEIPAWACKAKVGLVCDDGKCDSGPRVLSEYLAMGIPVLVRDTVRTDKDFYINSKTGKIVTDKNFAAVFKDTVANCEDFNPREFYNENLLIEKVAKQLVKQM